MRRPDAKCGVGCEVQSKAVAVAIIYKLTVLAEKLKVQKKLAETPVRFKQNHQESGKNAISNGNAHCATAGDTEQNGAEHFTVARRAIVTCFRRVMIVFAGICKENSKIVTCFARQKVLWSIFVAHEARYDFEASLANASQINRNAPKARYECAPRY